jgi:hypothetical protein
VVVLGGVTTAVKAAHVRLCHSRMPFVRAYPRETQETGAGSGFCSQTGISGMTA